MYRVHLQARRPRRFNTLAGAITYIRCMEPLWYYLDEWKDGEWVFLVRSDESRLSIALHDDPGEDENT